MSKFKVFKTNQLNLFVSRTSFAKSVFIFLFFLCFICVFFAFIYYFFQDFFEVPFFSPRKDFLESLLYSFSIQAQTADFNSEKGLAKILNVCQSFLDKSLWGLGIGYFTFKLLVPSPKTVIFSKSAFFLIPDNIYCFLLVNTSDTLLENLQFTVAEKYYRRHQNHSQISLPYLRNTALLVKICHSDISTLDPRDFDPNEDGVKLSLLCHLPFAEYSAAIKYSFYNIYIIENTEFMDIPAIQNPNLESDEFWNYFHMPIRTAEKFGDYFKRKRAQS